MRRYAFKKPLYILYALIFDILGTILFFPYRIFKRKPPLDPKNILVVRLDHIGDFVCTSPVFSNLRKRFPDANITALINSASKDPAYRDPNIDKAITFSPVHLARGEGPSTLNGLVRLIKDVKNIGFDLGIDPRGDLLSILIMWLGGVKFRVGYGITGGGFLLNREGRYDRSTHVIDRNLALLKDLNIPILDRSAAVYFNEKDIEAVEELLREGGVRPIQYAVDALGQTPQTPSFRAVVIHPFAGAVSRGWDKRNFQDLIDKLSMGGYTVYVIGTKYDECGYKNIIDMRSKFSLPQLAYFIKHIGAFIGLNSGPANIAAALGVPTVVISSGTNIIEDWIPPGDNTRFVYKDVACRPCERKICPKERYECMDGIIVEEVLDKFKEIASGKKGPKNGI